jgi:hypothetical protein
MATSSAYDELAALADGTLTGERRAELQARVDASPELQALLARQQRALAVVRTLDAERAPLALRERIEAQRERAAPALRWRRFSLALGLAVVAAAVVLALPAGAPSVEEAAALSARSPERSAPATEAEGLAYPDWSEKFGWAASGTRDDELDGRDATTVFYDKEGKRIGYTILSGGYVEPPGDAKSAERGGTTLRYFEGDGRTIVTWEREGRTCVLSGEGVEAEVLLDLAGWKPPV